MKCSYYLVQFLFGQFLLINCVYVQAFINFIFVTQNAYFDQENDENTARADIQDQISSVMSPFQDVYTFIENNLICLTANQWQWLFSVKQTIRPSSLRTGQLLFGPVL